jgi:4-amino-4-deoxy-L-arabinose transferase-like glycosyltransferase
LTEQKKYLLFMVLLHGVFFVLALTVGNIHLADSVDYIWQADNFTNTGSLYAYDFSQPIKIDYYTKRPPLYGLLVWAMQGVFGSLYVVIFLQNILSIFCAWLVYKLLRDNFAIKKPALWAALLWVALPNQLIYANTIMSETLLQLLITGAFYCFVVYIKTKQIKWVVLNNVLLMLALLTKPVMLFFWVINALVLIYFAIKNHQYLLPISVLLIPIAAQLWSAHNYRQTGYWHYSSITHVNLKDYNTQYYLFTKYGEPYGDSVITAINTKAATLPDYKTQCLYIKDTCTHILLSDVVGYGKFHAKGMVNFMADPGRYDYVSFFNIPQTEGMGLLYYLSKGNRTELMEFIKSQPIVLLIWLLLQMLINGVLLLLAIIYLFNKTTPLWPKIYLALLVGYIWFLTGPIGSARFKVPIYPLLAIAAAVAINHLVKKRKKEKNT